jgi:cytosine/adenosine deaminase-related metal-dependent hydrolase
MPLAGPPIPNGWVEIQGRVVAGLGSWDVSHPPSLEVVDLGEVVLLPGLVNAHCHLDYTCMAGLLPSPSSGFAGWIKGMNALRGSFSDSDYEQSWLEGAGMLLRSGCTTVADHEGIPSILAKVRSRTRLRVHSFIELIGIRKEKAPEDTLNQALVALAGVPDDFGSVQASPHAPYSTTPEILRLAAALARQRGWHLSVHLAESREEFDMFKHRKGPLFEWLESQRDMGDCSGCTPVQAAHRQGILSERTLAVHANYLDDEDIGLLAESKTSVVHCPRSHLYFKHTRFPYDRLAKAGVNICLGTDSLATMEKKPRKKLALDLFAEMRSFLRYHPQSSLEETLKMVTTNGAKALGLSGCIGVLTAGAQADIIALPYTGSVSSAIESIIFNKEGLTACMVGGTWIFRQ